MLMCFNTTKETSVLFFLQIDYENNMMISTAKSVDHPDYPPTSDYVRVGKYQSRMVIKPHRSFDEKGFDYVMSYFDDPQLYVPYWAVNRMTVSSKLLDKLGHTENLLELSLKIEQ